MAEGVASGRTHSQGPGTNRTVRGVLNVKELTNRNINISVSTAHPWFSTYKVLTDVIEVFAILLQGFFEQAGFGGRPLLHLVSAQDWSSKWHKDTDGTAQVIAVPVQCIHGMELGRRKASRECQVGTHTCRPAKARALNADTRN